MTLPVWAVAPQDERLDGETVTRTLEPRQLSRLHGPTPTHKGRVGLVLFPQGAGITSPRSLP